MEFVELLRETHVAEAGKIAIGPVAEADLHIDRIEVSGKPS